MTVRHILIELALLSFIMMKSKLREVIQLARMKVSGGVVSSDSQS